MAQLEELEARMKSTESVAKMVQDEIMSGFKKARKKQKANQRRSRTYSFEKKLEPSMSSSSGDSSSKETTSSSELDPMVVFYQELQSLDGQEPPTEQRKKSKKGKLSLQGNESARGSRRPSQAKSWRVSGSSAATSSTKTSQYSNTRSSRSQRLGSETREIARTLEKREKKESKSGANGSRRTKGQVGDSKTKFSGGKSLTDIPQVVIKGASNTTNVIDENNILDKSNSSKSGQVVDDKGSSGSIWNTNVSRNTLSGKAYGMNRSCTKGDGKNIIFANSANTTSVETSVQSSKFQESEVLNCHETINDTKNQHSEEESFTGERRRVQLFNKSLPIKFSRESKVCLDKLRKNESSACLAKGKMLNKQFSKVNNYETSESSSLPVGTHTNKPTNVIRTAQTPVDLEKCHLISSINENNITKMRPGNQREALNFLSVYGGFEERSCQPKYEKRAKETGKFVLKQRENKNDSRLVGSKPGSMLKKPVNTLQPSHLGLINKQHTSTMRRLAFKTDKLKVGESDEGGKVVNRPKDMSLIKLDDSRAKRYPLRSTQSSNLTLKTRKQYLSRNFRSPASSKNEKRSPDVTSLPKLPQTRNALPASVTDKAVQSTTSVDLSKMEPRRLLGELCTARRSLRENCLNILASVNLHSQRAPDIAEGGEI
ncbi:hypothetical protein ElyMa_006137900 [Elysia marginata]|uniref:Uncharacterized protein n=1 Tax=Elysia marginata TaxID=1093978 RepID=A0AAV4GYA2_9GAST|nr:hypothetical protein ElyMa_006137900 [Elysia marginata]